MRRFVRTWGVLLALLGRVPSWGEASAVEGTPAGALTLESAVAAALESDPRILTAQAFLALAQAQQKAAGAMRDPEARLGYSETQGTRGAALPREETWDEYSYGLRLFPLSPGARRARARAAVARVRAAEAGVRLAKWQVASEVRRLYADVRFLREQLAAAEHRLAATRRRQALAREKQERGAATALETSAASLDVLAAVRNRDRAAALLTEASSRLGALVGVADVSALDLPDAWEPPDREPAEPNADRLVETALAHRADGALAAWQMTAAEADLVAARRESQPWLSHVEVFYDEERGYQNDETWGVQAAISLPLFSRLVPGTLAAASGEVARRREELVATRARIRQEVLEALGAVRAAAQRWRDFQSEVEPVLRETGETLKGLEGRDEIGDDVRAELEEGLATAEGHRIEARHAHARAWLRLEEVLGTSLQEALLGDSQRTP